MDDLQIFDCEQGTPEWHACRAGIVTASELSTVLAKGRDGGASKTRHTYMLKLAGEILTGEVGQTWEGNAHTERGHQLEAEARAAYAFQMDCTPVLVGFMRRDRAGASPDALVGDDGLLEIKTKLPHLQLDVLLRDEVPSEHIPQIQGQLWISGRQWVDFVSYWPGLPIFIKRVHRDEEYISKLSDAVDQFNRELDEIVSRFTGVK